MGYQIENIVIHNKAKKFYIFRYAVLIVLAAISLGIFSCKRAGNAERSDSKKEIYQAIPSVCIWDKISARKEPRRNSGVVTPLNLGEAVTYLGINAFDSTYKNQEYLKVKLSDGSLVWVPAFSLITSSKPAVVAEEATIYLRPDMLTITDKKLAAMDIIAVMEEKDGWINFISDKKAVTGWIQEDNINYNKEEIAFALAANRILAEKSNKSLSDKIDSALNYNPYQNSIFVPMLKEIEKQEKEKDQVEEMMRQSINSFQE